MKEEEKKFTSRSSKMKMSAEDAAEQLGLLERLGNSFNAWAAAITIKHGELDDAKFEETYRISKDEARRLRETMYED